MPLFLALLLGHLLGDFVFQPGRLVVAKRAGLSGMLLHVGIVTACTAFVLSAQLENTLLAVVLSALAHLVIEHLTVAARRVRRASGLALFLLDQALHLVTLAIIAALIGNRTRAMVALWSLSVEHLAAICGIVAVTFLGSILAFEVRIVAMGPNAPAEPILRLDLARTYGFAERATALSVALFSPFPALGMLVFAPRATYALLRPRSNRNRHAIDTAVGLVLCVTAWILIRELGNISS